jgi:predicted dehydrogenase
MKFLNWPYEKNNSPQPPDGVTLRTFSPDTIPSGEPETKSQPLQPSSHKKLGLALVGLGNYSTGQLAPALKITTHCHLAGIVTGSFEKAEQWMKDYSIPEGNVYSYDNFDLIKDNPDIDIVYIVLPNAMHAEFTIRALEAGKHVICEKPMAISIKECEQMINAAHKAGRLLSIGYRLHFEPHHHTMREFGYKKYFGSVRKIIARDEIEVDANVWRLDKMLSGGGPLMDVGIYCVQGALYILGTNPIAVTAREGHKTDPEKFKDVEESISWSLHFPDNVVAECHTSYTNEKSLLRAETESGFFELDPAYDYSGIRGRTSNGKIDHQEVNQQALQMDDFALCVKKKRVSRVPGEMGMRDVKILKAIYESAQSGKRVTLTW